ncbi:universal stress protein [Halobacteriales archaeon Cl-PHB]
MYDRVLVPTDGSEGTSKTLDHALDLASRHDATVHAMAVVDERQFEGLAGEHRFETEQTLQDNCERAVEKVIDRAAAEGVDCETVIREGVPSQRIVEYAAEDGIDVVVMGTHGRSAHERIATLGSVTQRVVENADVPVFVVHIGRDTGWAE